MASASTLEPSVRRRNGRRGLRVAVVCDYLEEQWPSMDLVGEMIARSLGEIGGKADQIALVRPPMRRRAGNLPWLGASHAGRNADRLLNRFWDYHRYLRQRRDLYDVFHFVDHSYAQLVHAVPLGRAVVTCHDLDTFRCLLDPERDPRSKPFRWMAARTLSGLQAAAAVACVSTATADELRDTQAVPASRIHVVPNGVHPAFHAAADPGSESRLESLLGPASTGSIEILHVGSTIERKRIDVLIRVAAELAQRFPSLRLVRVGPPFEGEHRVLAESLGLAARTVLLSSIDSELLAAMYRRAALVLLPSDREGFGLPLIEALACGTPVAASDIPVLRDVGGDSAAYCPVADIAAWVRTVSNLLHERQSHPDRWASRRAAGLERAATFSWHEHARQLMRIYSNLLP